MPSTSTTDDGTKFVPETIKGRSDAPPAFSVDGLTVTGPGAGFFTAKKADAEVPPPGAALTVVNARRPVLARSAGARVTLSADAPVEMDGLVAPLT